MTITARLKSSTLFKDSFWAVFGNGTGNMILLLAGILIARLLGKDLYGEYGMVKTTMFYVAGFSTFGLGYTSTKFIAQYTEENPAYIRSVTISSLNITAIASLVMCLLLFCFAIPLADFINEPKLANAFRYLGLILVCRALSTTSSGIIAGYKRFKSLGINNILSGTIMLLLCVPLTYYYSVNGSLLALFLSQLSLVVLNFATIHTYLHHNNFSQQKSFTRELLVFSFPVALQELSYTICHWGTMLLLTKYASLGEVGLYTAASQWNAIIMFIPGLLSNVVLSYLSSLTSKTEEHDSMVKKMLLINFSCALIPFLVVFAFSGLIVSFYGKSFVGMQSVLNILILSTLFSCPANVFQSNLISEGRNWLLFSLRVIRDVLLISLLFGVLLLFGGKNAALTFSIIYVCVYASYLALLGLVYIRLK